jgi:protein-S-isoprenylcysteine O-methyltransferase Ste14
MSVTAKILLFTLLLPGSLVGFVPWLILRRHPQLLDPSLAHFGSIGLLMMVAGAAGYAWCAFEFGAHGRGTPAPFDPPKELVRTGLYRHLRNPMFTSIVALLFGEALLWHSTSVAIYAACMALGFHLRVVFFEEPRLRRRFGASFDRYCREVPRWLPRPATFRSPPGSRLGSGVRSSPESSPRPE